MKGYLLILVLVIVLAIGSFYLKRWWNYMWGYESQVTETICEMVKKEYLIDPSKCD